MTTGGIPDRSDAVWRDVVLRGLASKHTQRSWATPMPSAGLSLAYAGVMFRQAPSIGGRIGCRRRSVLGANDLIAR